MLDFDEDASAPFVLQLVGEYVIEIVTDIARRLTSEADDGPLLRRVRRFSAQNPGFTSLTQSRARSYWAAYYSSWADHYRTYDESPAATVLARLIPER